MKLKTLLDMERVTWKQNVFFDDRDTTVSDDRIVNA